MHTALTHILYVEDEPDIREVGTLALEAIGGFTVMACHSGADALQRIEGFSPQLALLDVMMPGMDGPTTFKSLRTVPGFSQLPVIFMTAKVQADEVAHYRALGAVDVIPKPFDPMALSQTIRDIWERQHA